MTPRHASSFFLLGALSTLGLTMASSPGQARAAADANAARSLVVPCDRRLPRGAFGGEGTGDATFAVKELPGKSASELARVRVLAKLRDVQSPRATYTENASVLLRDGVLMVACDGPAATGSGAGPAIESVLLVLPE